VAILVEGLETQALETIENPARHDVQTEADEHSIQLSLQTEQLPEETKKRGAHD
jgi:hypothetical protein